LAVPADSYGCHLGLKHSGSGELCGGGNDGGDGGDVATNDTNVRWYGAISEVEPRSCFLGFASTDGKAGHYDCVQSGQEVTFNLSGGQELDRKGQVVGSPSGICDEFTNLTMTESTAYGPDWEGGFCTSSSGCDIRVLNRFFEDPNRPLGTGLIIVEGFGHVDMTTNANPFADAFLQANGDINITEVLITLKGDGTNRTVATCLYSNLNVGFESVPAL